MRWAQAELNCQLSKKDLSFPCACNSEPISGVEDKTSDKVCCYTCYYTEYLSLCLLICLQLHEPPRLPSNNKATESRINRNIHEIQVYSNRRRQWAGKILRSRKENL